jgi:thiamine-phosphate diphosphorylase
VMMITGNTLINADNFVKKLVTHVANGTRLIQLRVKNLTESDYVALARKVLEATENHDVQIVLNCRVDCFEQTQAHGIHLTSDYLMSLDKRPLSNGYIVSAACHNLEQLMQAEKIGIDFVTLSPVLPTKTHPEANPLGWKLFSELCSATQVPIYALGGLTEEHFDMVISQGAYGLAGISSFWDKEI